MPGLTTESTTTSVLTADLPAINATLSGSHVQRVLAHHPKRDIEVAKHE